MSSPVPFESLYDPKFHPSVVFWEAKYRHRAKFQVHRQPDAKRPRRSRCHFCCVPLPRLQPAVLAASWSHRQLQFLSINIMTSLSYRQAKQNFTPNHPSLTSHRELLPIVGIISPRDTQGTLGKKKTFLND